MVEPDTLPECKVILFSIPADLPALREPGHYPEVAVESDKPVENLLDNVQQLRVVLDCYRNANRYSLHSDTRDTALHQRQQPHSELARLNI